jgi:hypothetical protein
VLLVNAAQREHRPVVLGSTNLLTTGLHLLYPLMELCRVIAAYSGELVSARVTWQADRLVRISVSVPHDLTRDPIRLRRIDALAPLETWTFPSALH